MSEFKFKCTKCGQNILAATDWSGRSIECPSCDTKITIPPAPKTPTKSAPAAPSTPAPLPKPSGTKLKVAASPDVSKVTSAPKTAAAPATPAAPPAPLPKPSGTKLKIAASPEATKDSPAPAAPAATTPAPTDGPQKDKPKVAEPAAKNEAAPAAVTPPADLLRIAVLTPAIKTEIVKAVRQRISEESKWLPGKIEEATAYAAKVVDGKNVLVEEKSPEATHFSLIGAFLLEYHLRKVTTTATGRTRLLDQEIPDAVREVLLEEMSEEEREKAGGEEAKVDVTAITHAQCLAALQVLEDRYTQRMDQARVEKAKKSIGNIKLADLVKKLEMKASMDPEDVATALYHEVMDLRRRLERLEKRNAGSK